MLGGQLSLPVVPRAVVPHRDALSKATVQVAKPSAAAGATPARKSPDATAAGEHCEVLKFRYEQCMEHAQEASTVSIGLGSFNIPCVSLYEEVMATCGSSFH
jgi:hypothetical protein